MNLLEQHQIQVTLEESEIEAQGKILRVGQVDLQTANMIAGQMEKIGIIVPVVAQDTPEDSQDSQIVGPETTRKAVAPDAEATVSAGAVKAPEVPSTSATQDNLEQTTQSRPIVSDNEPWWYSIKIGPGINVEKLDQARGIIKDFSVDFQEGTDTVKVKMFRLFQGVYPQQEALERLASIKKTAPNAFVLKEDDSLRLYAGSFHDHDRAIAFMNLLEQQQIQVTIQECEIEAQGKILAVQQVDLQTANMIVEQMKKIGITVPVLPKDAGSQSQPTSYNSAREITAPGKPSLLYSIKIGPCMRQIELDQARAVLKDYPVDIREGAGVGPVKMYRLLEGIYPQDEALERLKTIKKTADFAFVLKEDDKLRLYAGSFHDHDRALAFIRLLEQHPIRVTLEESEIRAQGKILTVQQVELQTAETIAEQMMGMGLHCTAPVHDL